MSVDVWPEHFGNQSYGDGEEPEIDVEEIRFGGGCSQRIPNSIEYIRNGMVLKFTRRKALANEMYVWILSRAKRTPFYCAFPDATPGNYICEGIRKEWVGPNHTTLTVTLKQDFNLS